MSYQQQPAWGPRPGGPAIPPPSPAQPSGCLVVLMIGAAFVGLILLSLGKYSTGVGVVGLLVLVGVVWFFVNLFNRPSKIRRAGEGAQRRYHEDFRAWADSRPQMTIGRAADAVVAARDMTVSTGGGAFLGITPDLPEWSTASRDQAVLVLGPPRSGKTASIIIPSVLHAAGAVVSTATKRDVLEATYRTRSRFGRVWLFDPSGEEEVPAGVLELQWSPVWPSRRWDGARAMAEAMVNASNVASSPGGHGGDNAYWTESAKGLLGPMLHAAALSNASIAEVRRWILREDYETPGKILVAHKSLLAADDLQRVSQTEDRERGSVVNTAATVLRAYGSQTVLDHCQNPNFDVGKFVTSHDTIYITSPGQQQEMLAPLVVGLLEEIRNAAYRSVRQNHDERGQGRASMLWALDEIANIAPIKTLPAIVSEAGSQGLQVMACFQDLSQASVRWGKAADGFLTLFGTKVVFPGIGDRQTLEALSMMVGDWDRPYVATSTNTGQSFTYGMVPGRTNSFGSSITYSTQRESLVSPSEIANIPQGNALVVRSGRWSLVEHTPYFCALPWTTVTSQSPPRALDRGGPDRLVDVLDTSERDAVPRVDPPLT